MQKLIENINWGNTVDLEGPVVNADGEIEYKFSNMKQSNIRIWTLKVKAVKVIGYDF